MEEIHYCTNCMKKSILTIGSGDACPSCDAHNFMLLRGGQIGTAMLFERYNLSSDSFEWVPGHYEKCREAE